ncbi:hypothetical protein NP493_1200g00000 [Ridgeia piscesae]|uniref:Uncharacterized protein n=1 Tax=Ridgeia piscesae TaxID=27915 RepID=A0AAD9KEF8_RIDPI|nr:hypothetical protein NP493_1200g00000 [Ridgeia piscesae]
MWWQRYRTPSTTTTERPWWGRTTTTERPWWGRTTTTERPWWGRTTTTERPWWGRTTTTERPWWGRTTTTERLWWGRTTTTKRPWWGRTTTTERPWWGRTTSTERPTTTGWWQNDGTRSTTKEFWDDNDSWGNGRTTSWKYSEKRHTSTAFITVAIVIGSVVFIAIIAAPMWLGSKYKNNHRNRTTVHRENPRTIYIVDLEPTVNPAEPFVSAEIPPPYDVIAPPTYESVYDATQSTPVYTNACGPDDMSNSGELDASDGQVFHV